MNYRQPSVSCVQSSLFGEPSTVHLIAAALLRRVIWSYVHLIEHADLGAEPMLELEFDQTLGGNPALQRWHMWLSADWCGSGTGVVRRVVWAAKSE